MKTHTLLSIGLAVVIGFGTYVPTAHADGRGRSVGKVVGRAAGAAIRGNRGGAPSIRIPNLGGGGNVRGGGGGFPILEALGRAANSNNRNSRGGSPFPILDALQRLDNGGNNGRNKNHSDAENFLYGLSQLGQYGRGYGYGGGGYGYGGYGGYGNDPYPYYDSHNRYKAQEEYSDAMRDAAIANAVGNVVSTIISSESVRTQPPVYVQQAPVYAQPAPQMYSAPAPVQRPLGRYETRREIVSGGYYERSQIWVPEARDPRTGHIIEGHNETVRQWVPEVVQETQVWIAP